MTTQNNSRTSDMGTILDTHTGGFIKRKHSGVGLVFHLFVLASMVVLSIALLIYYRSPNGSVLVVAIASSVAVIAHNLEKAKKHRELIEFMNALFSSALGEGWKFCFIVKNTGDIVFYNRAFQNVFPAYIKQDNRTLGNLLRIYHVQQSEREALNAFITSSTKGNTNIALKSQDDVISNTISFHVEPIERPTGYFLVRGK
jgi:hypothetical protein